MTAALLVARDARIDEDGATLLDAFSFEAAGDRVAVVGGFRPLLSLLFGRASLVHGSVEVSGVDARSFVRQGSVGLVDSASPLPESWTVSEYLRVNARLAGLCRRDAARAVPQALDGVGLGALQKRKIGVLGRVERRVLALANGALSEPPVLVAASPLSGLSAPEADRVRAVLDRLAAARRLLVLADGFDAVGPESSLIASMNALVVLVGGRVVGCGAPDATLESSRRYVVCAARNGRALADALGARGIQVEPHGADGGEGLRWVAHLPDGEVPGAIVGAALSVDAPLLELVPSGLVPRRT